MKKFLLSFKSLRRSQYLFSKATLLLALFLLINTKFSFAQQAIQGIVTDGTNPIAGATISITGTSRSTSTDVDGKFSLSTTRESGEIVISYVGYDVEKVNFSSGTTDIGTISLKQSAQSLDEVIVQIGSGLIDLAKDRKTPIAVSTISTTEIQQKAGNQEFPELLKNTPSVYVAGQAGGYGDSRIIVRGFDQTNTAFLLNGQPINGMEDGNMYWSNWSGLADVANALQIQRGLGSSKLAISSVGGTVNIVTKSTDLTRGGFAQALIGNNNYQKTTLAYNTGLSENGWAASIMLTNWAGDGYNKGTRGNGQNYFFSLGYKPNEKHAFNFLIFGAPQKHDQNFTKSISSYLQNGKRYNTNYGFLGGDYLSERTNYYHKPVVNLNWDFNIDEKSTLSTVAYASWGRGGGTGNWGSSSAKKYTPSGHIDFNAIKTNNEAIEGGIGDFNNGAYAIRASVNNHACYGLVSNFNRQINENLTYNLGLDVRTYKGTHYRMLTNLMGLTGWHINDNMQYPNGYNVTETFSINPWKALTNSVDNNQKVDYDYDERITYGGLFGQIEYSNEDFSAFLQGALSNQSHVRWDRFQYTKENEKSEKVNNIGYNIKGGLSYNITENHVIFGNTGYYSRQPYHDNIYLNFGNDVNPLTSNEKIFGVEFGYKFISTFFSANLNAYRTSWKDRVTTTSDTNDDGQLIYTNNSGLSQLHQGLELDFVAKPLPKLDLRGFASIGDWKYDDNALQRTYDESLNLLSEEVTDVKGGKVGDAAQTTFGLGVAYRITSSLSVDADYRNYSNLYADVVTKDNIKLPNYDLVDAGLNYRISFNKTALNLRLNVNNIFDRVYLSEMTSARPVEEGTETYKGINTSNNVFFGNGTTWNFGMKFSF
jgi:outer membrane receptor protein involved in Fe transport